ncbi:MAG TPA: hypothetical protein PK867_17455 [Pirellulales bacterium]|nr:hypothetical protein [Pirellulales bacterium]
MKQKDLSLEHYLLAFANCAITANEYRENVLGLPPLPRDHIFVPEGKQVFLIDEAIARRAPDSGLS